MTPTEKQRAWTDRITGASSEPPSATRSAAPSRASPPSRSLERHGGRVHGIVGPWNGDDWRTARPIAPYHKGDGHVTDDTLMTHALVRVYAAVRDHLDAYAVAEHLVPDLMTNPRWIPELEAEALPLQRIFLAEKWMVARLHYGHVDPREAGVGNIVNCGAAMYMAPVGMVNAGHPAGAYAEAWTSPGAHQSSYGREAAGVFAAAVAAACVPGATARLGGGRRPSRWPRTAPARRSRRCAKWPAATRTSSRRWPRCGRRWPRTTRWARTTAPPRSAPAARPASTRSRNSRSRSACWWSPAASTSARSSAR